MYIYSWSYIYIFILTFDDNKKYKKLRDIKLDKLEEDISTTYYGIINIR